jgi:glycosyltransferase involved in cell wall biosynthesis
MPCYNSAAFLGEALASALGQRFRDIELIAVNDGSTDGTRAILEAIDDDRLVVIDQTNQGVCAARNRALEAARGEFTAFLDADDYWSPEFLEKMLRALRNDPGAGIAYCGWHNVGLDGGRGQPYVPPDYEERGKLEVLLDACPWPIHAALTRTVLVRDAGGFNRALRTSEDYQLWLAIAYRQRIVRVPEVLAFYRHHGATQATRDAVRVARDHWSVQQSFLAAHPEIRVRLGTRRIRQLTVGRLLQRAYAAYWQRDLDTARYLFRRVMSRGYGRPRDWLYMLPSLLPASIHRFLIGLKSGERVP